MRSDPENTMNSNRWARLVCKDPGLLASDRLVAMVLYTYRAEAERKGKRMG